MDDERGLTLAELLVALVVLAMLAVVAMPKLGALVQGNRLDAVVGDAVSEVELAVSEALRRGLPVTVCPTAGSADVCDSGGMWRDDWMTFVDVNGNGRFDPEDTLLRRRGGWGTGVVIVARTNDTSARLQRLTVDADGLFAELPAGARLLFDIPSAFTEVVRCVTFSNFASESMLVRSGKGGCA